VQSERLHRERRQELTQIMASIPTIIWKADVDDHGALINTYPVEITPSVIDIGGQTCVFGVFRDVAERKQAEQALRESEENLRFVLESIPAAVFVHNLSGEFLVVNKTTVNYTGYTTSTMTGPYYRDLWRMQADPKQITMTYEIEDSASIFADYRMVETILRNLIANAIHFTPHGGEIRIKAQKRDDVVEVAVIDNGIGMSADQARNLFDQERTTGPGRDIDGHQGTGLGLILCQDFVARPGARSGWKASRGWAARSGFNCPHLITSMTHPEKGLFNRKDRRDRKDY
jgi:signal transduction histidine kinase